MEQTSRFVITDIAIPFQQYIIADVVITFTLKGSIVNVDALKHSIINDALKHSVMNDTRFWYAGWW